MTTVWDNIDPGDIFEWRLARTYTQRGERKLVTKRFEIWAAEAFDSPIGEWHPAGGLCLLIAKNDDVVSYVCGTHFVTNVCVPRAEYPSLVGEVVPVPC